MDGRLDGSEDAGDDSSNVGVGEEAIDRLGQAIGAENLMRVISPMITAALATPAAADGSEWPYYFAGLSALSQVSITKLYLPVFRTKIIPVFFACRLQT